jgi:hypothetical protein
MVTMNTAASRYTGTLTRHEIIMAVGAIVSVVLPLLFASSNWWALAAFFVWVVLCEVFGLTQNCSADPVQGWLRAHGHTGLADSLDMGPASREELWLLVASLIAVGVLLLFSAYVIALIAFWVFCVPMALLTVGAMLLPR